jgi:hypothetical protein
MHTLQLALEDFATASGGYFPTDFGITVREVLEQVGVESEIGTSIAGAPGVTQVFGGEIGQHGAVFLPENFRNSLDPWISPLPALVLSKEDPPEWVGPGVTYYVPIDVEEKIAKRYKIYGSYKDSLFNLVLTSEK